MRVTTAYCQHCGRRIRLTLKYASGWIHLRDGKPLCYPPDARVATPREIAA